jgi:hypothetical protein
MGDAAEDLYHRALMQEAKEEIGYNNLREKIWTTKAGKKIKVKNMSDNHVKNTMNLLCKSTTRSGLKDAWISVFMKECKRRNLKL